MIRIGIIGGSGLYKMSALTDIEEYDIDTPFGKPSDPIVVGTLNGERVAFVARHGRGHRYTPSEVPYAANIYALKMLGVQYIIAASACGSLREDYAPGHFVIPDQLVDFTKGKRRSSFFDNGVVAHVGVAEPFCEAMRPILAEAVEAAGGVVHHKGNFITVEGPRFSTKAESNLFRQWGMDIIGMTTSPEAFLAREAEICYGIMAMVTDYDVWHEEMVSVEMVMHTFQQNLNVAQQALIHAVPKVAQLGETAAHYALRGALTTGKSHITDEHRERLEPFISSLFNE
ncbi:MAG: S-methyl-5'-thioadenosine phosphorylase [Phototrophicales bacterium]|nr:MAG: S-methyl-5'-thioadenosine phosphorylase [Phototrophicales bacterium]